MNKQEIINKLSELPREIESQEQAVIAAYEQVQESKFILTEAEDVLQLSGAIDGKNAEIRSSQLRAQTASERQAIQKAESNLSRERAALNRLNNELESCKAIATLLKE